MTSRDFAFWLQGYFELNGVGPLSKEQAELVQRHLALVFKHEIDPSAGGPTVQAELNKIHTPKPPKIRPHGRPSGSDLLRC